MAEAIILFSGDSLWTLRLERPKKNWVHGVLLTISVLALTAGIACETWRKNDTGSSHFVTNHAITGKPNFAVSLLVAVVTVSFLRLNVNVLFIKSVTYLYY